MTQSRGNEGNDIGTWRCINAEEISPYCVLWTALLQFFSLFIILSTEVGGQMELGSRALLNIIVA